MGGWWFYQGEDLNTNIIPIETQSLKDACTTRLEQMILSGELKIGERLPSERDFAARLGVSRPVLHQSLVDLAAKGLVEIIPRRGVFISDYRRDGSLAMLSSLLSYHGGKLDADFSQSMLDMRLLVETETARLAATQRSEKDMQGFCAILEKERQTAQTQTLTDLDFDFHLSIAIASGNHIYPLIINSFKDVYTSLTEKFFLKYSGTPIVAEVHQFHENLVNAFKNEDADSAVQIMSAMLEHGEAYLKKE